MGAFFVIVQFEEAKFGGANCGADELIDIALVLGVEEELSLFFELEMVVLFKLDNMLEDEFFFGSIFFVGDTWIFLLFELTAALELFVDDWLTPLEELQQLVIHLVLHFKYV